MKVLVTGADGFIGRHLQNSLTKRGIEYRAAVRARSGSADSSCYCPVGDIGPDTDWGPALAGVDSVIHLAGRAHVLRETDADPLAAFMRVNALGTAGLVGAAVAAKVRRFVYASSVGVLGNASGAIPFTQDSRTQPHNPYTQSKLAGEAAVQSAASQLEVVIVRPPLVYGTGVRANFLRLLQWVERGWPLPCASLANRRSLVNVWNLCDLLVNVLSNGAAPGRAWLVSDGEDLSTPDLVSRIAHAMGRRARMLPVPYRALRMFGELVGRQEQLRQLCESLQVNIEKTRAELCWTPPVPVNEALRWTAEWYLAGRSQST